MPYDRFCLRHLRRYAFIAQEMRRVNRAASTVLLELWVAWGASMLILLWTIRVFEERFGKGWFQMVFFNNNMWAHHTLHQNLLELELTVQYF